ncbi:MAG: SPFH domain-containing protein [Magnetococcales bacterium]|nr:SPFH domain-containing protein [Magnetococcales bacterium]
MFGFRYLKTQPTQYVIVFRNGKPLREGAGLALFYFAPMVSVVVVPTGSVNVPFMFEQVTADFQEITIQGQLTYRISHPRKTSELMDFSVDANGQHLSDDPEKLPQRLIDQARVALTFQVGTMPLKEALSANDGLVSRVLEILRNEQTVVALGTEILGLSILAVKPKPETARAMEAEVREELLRLADEATYARRNAAVEQERIIRQNEPDTEIAIETKRRQVREVQVEADRSVREKERLIAQEDMEGQIFLEERRRQLVECASSNARREADDQAYAIEAVLKSFAGSDAKILQALATVGMNPGQLMALAFRDIAENANKIGQLNISPDLLNEIIGKQGRA